MHRCQSAGFGCQVGLSYRHCTMVSHCRTWLSWPCKPTWRSDTLKSCGGAGNLWRCEHTPSWLAANHLSAGWQCRWASHPQKFHLVTVVSAIQSMQQWMCWSSLPLCLCNQLYQDRLFNLLISICPSTEEDSVCVLSFCLLQKSVW